MKISYEYATTAGPVGTLESTEPRTSYEEGATLATLGTATLSILPCAIHAKGIKSIGTRGMMELRNWMHWIHPENWLLWTS